MRIRSAGRASRAILAVCTALGSTLGSSAGTQAQRTTDQREEQRSSVPRVYLSAWGGGFTDIGGFTETDVDAYFAFQRTVAYGGSLHVLVGQGLVLGIDGSWARPSYERRDRLAGTLLNEGEASVASGLLSVRLTGSGGGGLSPYLTGGAGVFAYEVPEPDLKEWDMDFALSGGAGIDYRFLQRLGLFLEYGRVWAYHQKGDAERNTANHDLVRLGTRIGI